MDRKSDFQKSDETNELILKAAAQVFAENGYKDSTIQLIAKKAGLVPSGIYYYYAGKKELLEAVAEYLISYLENSVFKRWREVIDKNGLESFIDDAIEVFQEEKTYIRLLSILIGSNELDDSYRKRLSDIFLYVKEGIRKHISDEETVRESEELAEDMYAYIFFYEVTGNKAVFNRQMRQSKERYKKIMEGNSGGREREQE